MTVLLLAAAAIHAQQRTVAGTVSDVKGSPLAGVEITVEGCSTLYTATGEDGRYSIAVPDSGKAVLHFYLMGFLSQDIALAEHSGGEVDVMLEEDYMNLETVVVTGTRTPRLLKESPIQTRVITGLDIQSVDALNIGDLLESELPVLEFSYAMYQQVTLNLHGF